MKKLFTVLFAAVLSLSLTSGTFAAPGGVGGHDPAAVSVKGKKVSSSSSSFVQGNKIASPSDKRASKKPSVTISRTSIDPGESLMLNFSNVANIKTYSVENSFDFTPRIAKLGNTKGEYFAFLPVSYHATRGSYPVTVKSSELPGGKTTFTVTVSNKKFYEQWLTVDKSLADDTINSDEASKEFRRVIWPKKEEYDPAKYFDGPFIMPISGRVTTQFGSRRLVNGVPNFRHDGVDLAAAEGTPIKAAQNGKVIYSGFVKLTGNTIIIEHGMGLKSWYEHLIVRNVEEGDMVKTGDIIGKVGSTGFSTGAHLHFSASVNSVFINPYTLVETDMLKF